MGEVARGGTKERALTSTRAAAVFAKKKRTMSTCPSGRRVIGNLNLKSRKGGRGGGLRKDPITHILHSLLHLGMDEHEQLSHAREEQGNAPEPKRALTSSGSSTVCKRIENRQRRLSVRRARTTTHILLLLLLLRQCAAKGKDRQLSRKREGEGVTNLVGDVDTEPASIYLRRRGDQRRLRGRKEERYVPCVAETQAAEKQRARQAIPKTGVRGEASRDRDQVVHAHGKRMARQGTERKGGREKGRHKGVREPPSHRKWREKCCWGCRPHERAVERTPQELTRSPRSLESPRSLVQPHKSIDPTCPSEEKRVGAPSSSPRLDSGSFGSPLAHRSWAQGREGRGRGGRKERG